ncbi:hypothetical protein [Planctomyces sp. SH-PL14]|uniref:hypothetical protein n=1 Tax=Planctomyces sp. SH-PL14 TaxID=1632864 RepID=UPI00078DDF9E|nr:hypothetical protein [Planctomyces sp. SH-PL14]AMV16608.1 hypothetical protein VT03_01880 [Planctomyces sp. SH-PL14]
MAFEQLVNVDFGGVAKPVNLPDPTSPQDAATKAYADSLIEGLNWKDNVRLATTGNVNLSSPGGTIDGVTPATDDRILVKSQTDETENGIYFYTGSSSAMTRCPDADTFDKLENAVVTVDEGTTNAQTRWRQTEVNGTLDTDDIVWDSFDAAVPDASTTVKGKVELATQGEVDAGTDQTRVVTPETLAGWAGRKFKYTSTFGNGSDTVYTITHNLGTKELVAQVRRASNDNVVGCDIQMTSTTAATVTLAAAPGSNALKIVILG